MRGVVVRCEGGPWKELRGGAVYIRVFGRGAYS
jgi:hypothetical protein